MLFELWDPDHALPADLAARLRAAGHRSRAGAEGPDLPVPLGTTLLLGEGPGLEARVSQARDAGGEAVLITLRTLRDSARSARLIRLGADDDLVLPVPVAELIARVEAVRRVHGRGVDAPGGAVRVFGVTVFPDGRAPEVDGSPLPLSTQEGRVLTHLLRCGGRPVPRETLHAALFALTDKTPSGRVVDVHVCNLRRKLRAALGARAPRISTARGLGYIASAPAG